MEDLGSYCVVQLQLLEELLSTGLPHIEEILVLHRIQILRDMLARYDARLVAMRMPVRRNRLPLPRTSLPALRLSILLSSHLMNVSVTSLPLRCPLCHTDEVFCLAVGLPHRW